MASSVELQKGLKFTFKGKTLIVEDIRGETVTLKFSGLEKRIELSIKSVGMLRSRGDLALKPFRLAEVVRPDGRHNEIHVFNEGGELLYREGSWTADSEFESRIEQAKYFSEAIHRKQLIFREGAA